MTKMKMQAHGHVELKWRGNVFYNYVHGPFNLEGTSQCFEKIKNNVLLNHSPSWARIDILDTETLGAPEVMKMIGATYVWCIENGCIVIASVCSTMLQAEMLEQTRIKTGLPLAGFDTLEEAEQWCYSQLAGDNPFTQ